MPKQPRTGEQVESGPPKMPSTNPPYPSSDYSFTLQAVMEMQRALGQLTEAVSTLKVESKDNREKLNTISHKIYAATAILAIVTAILGAFSGKIIAAVSHLLK
jgi:hypothetical protein